MNTCIELQVKMTPKLRELSQIQWVCLGKGRSGTENWKSTTVYHPENSLQEHSTLFMDVHLRGKTSWILEI